MSDSFLPYGRQSIDEADIQAVVDVLKSSHLTQGPAVERFESKLGELTSAPYVSAVANGTAALHLAYAALGLGPGDELITSPNTFVATANAARLLGAEVRFADVDAQGNIDAESVAALVGPRTKGVAAVHFAGLPADLSALRTITERHGLWLVEDAAHALGASYAGSTVGACELSDATTFSFHPVKHATTGEGGAVSTRRPDLKRKLDLLREHGIERKPAEGSLGLWGYTQSTLGFNYRLSDIACALGSSQLDKLSAFVERRRAIAGRYRAGFSGIANERLSCLAEPEGRVSSYHLFPVLVDFEGLGLSRGRVMAALKARGIGSQVHYIPVCDQPYYASRASSNCPNARRFYERELSLPMYSALTDADVDRVIAAVSEIIARPLSAAV